MVEMLSGLGAGGGGLDDPPEQLQTMVAAMAASARAVCSAPRLRT
ncbi:MAG TPA: hypothetical protein VKQ31_10955 [Steroidobacteraceae bacterium]|nr:hypothetical protein [Steroidobacteraceae bacterium]